MVFMTHFWSDFFIAKKEERWRTKKKPSIEKTCLTKEREAHLKSRAFKHFVNLSRQEQVLQLPSADKIIAFNF